MLIPIPAGPETIVTPATPEKTYDVWRITSLVISPEETTVQVRLQLRLTRITESNTFEDAPGNIEKIVSLPDLYALAQNDSRYLDWMNMGLTLMLEAMNG